ncbi:MAG: hypothetical protein ABJZ55_06315 [Fuerstiella sp.]
MNSDSPSPFLGLQLAVDADSPSVQIPTMMQDRSRQAADSADLPAHDLASRRSLPNAVDQTAVAGQAVEKSDFRFTASENSMSGDLKMSLPKSKPKSGSPEADQLADLLHRLKRS